MDGCREVEGGMGREVGLDVFPFAVVDYMASNVRTQLLCLYLGYVYCTVRHYIGCVSG